MPETGQVWYESERGPLPVDPEVLRQARESGPPAIKISSPLFAPDPNPTDPNPGGPTAATTPSSERQDDSATTAATGEQQVAAPASVDSDGKSGNGRRAIPADVLRTLCARAGHRCERCQNASGPFDVHHRRPVSEGGKNVLSDLQLLCQSCHAMKHEQDYASKPGWAAARAAQQAAQQAAQEAAQQAARQEAQQEARQAARHATQQERKEVQAASDDDEYQEPTPNRCRFPVRPASGREGVEGRLGLQGAALR